jgi:glutamate racemase
VIVIDSGLGGLSVVRALAATHPARPLIYLADTAGFPYGKRSRENMSARARNIVGALVAQHPIRPIVLACNTLSTLCLDDLRAHFSTPFVGTVPAIKPAASLSKTRRFTLLATPNTAASEYSSSLIAQFASDCVVDSYGAPHLAAIAEKILLGDAVDDDSIRAELAPAFFDDARGRTDCLVLGCTHYPLIAERLDAVAPWPVAFVDSSAAIARRALTLADTPPPHRIAYVTADTDIDRYREVFRREGFVKVHALTVS